MSKKLVYFFVLICSIGLFTGCSDDEEEIVDNRKSTMLQIESQQPTQRNDGTIQHQYAPIRQSLFRKVPATNFLQVIHKGI